MLDQSIMDPTAAVTVGTTSTALSIASTMPTYHVAESTGIEVRENRYDVCMPNSPLKIASHFILIEV